MEFNLNQTLQDAKGAIVIGLPENIEELKHFDSLDALFNGHLMVAIDEGVLSTKLGQVRTTGSLLQTEYRKIITVGLGHTEKLTRLNMQEALGNVFQFIKKNKTKKVAMELDSFIITTNEFSYDIGLLSEMSTYQVYSYKEREEIEIEVSLLGKVDEKALLKGQLEGRAINFARDFSEMPPNELYPESFANKIVDTFNQKNVTVTVKDEKTLEKEGYGLLTSVGRGSTKPPRLVTIEYKPKNVSGKPVALVGKGITYDSGGYSLKPRTGMVGMKYDMSGAANVLGMMKALIDQEVDVHVVAIVALAENMVAGDANRPDDVYISKKGLSVEVTNTDAEGRLVLADAVYEATSYDPVVIMDFATLTGAVIGALGMERTGLFTNKGNIFTLPILESSYVTGEKLWHLPMDEIEDKAVRESQVADLTNSNLKPFGGASFAASFIEKFVEDYPWLHFDIAGTSEYTKQNAYGPKGASGVMIRTVLDYIKARKMYE